MNEVKNLWSDEILQAGNLLLPSNILKQQAQYFNEMTKNVLVATAESKKGFLTFDDEDEGEWSKPILLHRLFITAPILENYSFDLVRLEQEEVVPYPVEIYAPLTAQRYEANNDEEVQKILENIFKEPKTVIAIQSLLSQSAFKSEDLPF